MKTSVPLSRIGGDSDEGRLEKILWTIRNTCCIHNRCCWRCAQFSALWWTLCADINIYLQDFLATQKILLMHFTVQKNSNNHFPLQTTLLLPTSFFSFILLTENNRLHKGGCTCGNQVEFPQKDFIHAALDGKEPAD